MLHKLKKKIRHLLTVYRWKKETVVCREQITSKDSPVELPKGRYLVLIPHADDEWVGCSQLICNKSKEVILLNMDMDGGDAEELHIERRKELDRLASLYKRELLHIDGNKIESLKEILAFIKPDYVCLPYFFDWHPEHIEVMSILNEASKQIAIKCNVLMYQVSLPILPSECNCWQAMTKSQWKKKWQLFEKVYKTQTQIPYKRFAYNERINGALANSIAAELYQVIPIEVWRDKLSVYLLDGNEKDEIKHVMKQIGETRALLSRFLKKRK